MEVEIFPPTKVSPFATKRAAALEQLCCSTRKACHRAGLGVARSHPRMEVTQEDLARACHLETAAFTQCSAEHGTGSGVCTRERLALERCANATVAMVRSINASCGDLYRGYESCCRHAAQMTDCAGQARDFWRCAEQFSPTPLTDSAQ